jgi:integrase
LPAGSRRSRVQVTSLTPQNCLQSRRIRILNFAHGIFAFALKHGWCTSNPVAATDRPEAEQADPDIRFLDLGELEALLRAAAARASIGGEDEPDVRGPTDHVLYLAAAMTGIREGELIALRWRDVDWSASLIRVRRNYTRGNWGTPKSKRSSRAVPMADRLGGELDRHYKRSVYQGDDHLVFCHPQTGKPYDASQLRKRFYDAMTAAGMAHRCGHEGGITFHSLRHTFGTRMAAAGDTDAQAAGVDGASQPRDDGNLCGLHTRSRLRLRIRRKRVHREARAPGGRGRRAGRVSRRRHRYGQSSLIPGRDLCIPTFVP